MTRQEIYVELKKLQGDWKGAIRAEYKKSWTNCSNEELVRFISHEKSRLTPTRATKGHECSLPDPVGACIKKLGEELDKSRFINEGCDKEVGYGFLEKEGDDPFRSILRGLKGIIDKVLSR